MLSSYLFLFLLAYYCLRFEAVIFAEILCTLLYKTHSPRIHPRRSVAPAPSTIRTQLAF